MTNTRPRRLGRGLSSLIDAGPAEIQTNTDSSPGDGKLHEIPLDSIHPSQFQPRRRFDERRLEELAASIRQAGVMQPVVVRPRGGGGFELIAGERRWRAARLAGLQTIPAVVRALDNQRSAELALIENVQRADLNPIERAWAFQALIAGFGLTQQQVADRVGLDRSSVANMLRLLELPEDLQHMVAEGALSGGHGKILVSVADAQARRRLAERIVAEQLSVRQTEAAVRELRNEDPEADPGMPALPPDRKANISDLERRLSEHLKTRVQVKTRGDGTSGELRLAFYSIEHFEGLLRAVGFENT